MPIGGCVHDARSAPLLALGIVSAPMATHAGRRAAIRQTWLSTMPWSIAARFVVRHGSCGAAAPLVVADADAPDMLLLSDVCQHESRLRGSVLSVYRWLGHAQRAFPQARFLGKADDDVWLNLPELQSYLNVIAARASTHVLAGRLFYSNMLVLPGSTRSEQDIGFGFNCRGAVLGYHRHRPHVANGSSLGEGPFAFATGFLAILSSPLAAALTDSAELRESMQHIERSGNGTWGLDDKWLGSVVRRFARPSNLTLVDLGGALSVDLHGMHQYSTGIVWHNIMKKADRLEIIHAFPQRHGCSSPEQAASRRRAKLECAPSAVAGTDGCAPDSTFCAVVPLCEQRHFELNYTDWNHHVHAAKAANRATISNASAIAWTACDCLSLHCGCIAKPPRATKRPSLDTVAARQTTEGGRSLQATTTPSSPPCRKPFTELTMNSIVAGLFHEQRIPSGAIIDAGAHDGSWSCLYAVLSGGTRAVYAIEPLAGNVKKIEAMRSRHLPLTRSIKPMVGALGNSPAWLDAGFENRIGQLYSLNQQRTVASAAVAKAPFRMYRLDDLVVDGGAEHSAAAPVISGGFGFAHFDCEGSELDVLRGGVRAIQRWRPIFTVELHVHANQTYTLELLSLIDRLGYDVYLVEEPCGPRLDCRNLLCLPRDRRETLLDSPTLDLAASAGVLLAVHTESILRYAYPCCRAGAACCPRARGGGGSTSKQYPSCCSHWRIDEWRRGANLTHNGSPKELVRAERWSAQNWWKGSRGYAAAATMSRWQP